MRLKTPFEASFGTIHQRSVLLVEVAADGVTGWGEVTTTEEPFYNSETVETAWLMISKFLVPRIVGQRVSGGNDIPRLFAAIRGHEMARAGIETAVWDLEAKQKGQPLWKLLGGQSRELPCGVSLGIHSCPESLVETTDRELAAGYQRIKLKIKPGKDLTYVEAVRRRYPDILLSVDANSAYTDSDTAHLRPLDGFNLLMIEQPLWWDDIYQHARLQQVIRTPICLDESIRHLRDTIAAIELQACRILNIKLGRVGGHSSAKDIQTYCGEKKIPVWCGGMFESGIGRAHNIAMSTLPSFTLPGDVSASQRYWEEDIIEPEVTVTLQGTITPSLSPGIGHVVRHDLIELLTLEQESWRAD